jgi:hypothetical protein
MHSSATVANPGGICPSPQRIGQSSGANAHLLTTVPECVKHFATNKLKS